MASLKLVRKCVALPLMVILLVPSVGSSAEEREGLKAFPGAFGAGASITGGRGGKVIAVTRLDDAEDENGKPREGTLRYAVTREFPRTVIFRVSGTIVIGDTDGDGEIDRDTKFPSYLFGSKLHLRFPD